MGIKHLRDCDCNECIRWFQRSTAWKWCCHPHIPRHTRKSRKQCGIDQLSLNSPDMARRSRKRWCRHFRLQNLVRPRYQFLRHFPKFSNHNILHSHYPIHGYNLQILSGIKKLFWLQLIKIKPSHNSSSLNSKPTWLAKNHRGQRPVRDCWLGETISLRLPNHKLHDNNKAEWRSDFQHNPRL